MGIDCHLFAVDAHQIEELKANPALVLGRGMLQRMPSCDLHKAWHAIHFLLTGSADEAKLPEGFLLCGGYELDEGDFETDPARLLTPKETLAFHRVLEPFNDVELQKRFNHQAMVAADVYSIHGDNGDSFDDEGWGDEDFDANYDQEGLDVEDWTLDQADDFEFIAHYLDELRTFIAQAAANRRGVVIVVG